ncbi:MAG: hypothetical protein NXI31_26160 [bacterium]|nr:hypothetical protein [bacterium]
MDPDRPRLRTELRVPPPGGSVRVAMGDSEFVFEAVRGGFTLLRLQGREADRHVLGLPDGGRTGEVILELRPPEWPVRLQLREVLVLAPGARVHGYVRVPLVPAVTWCTSPTAEPVRLLDFPPRTLSAEWDDQIGTVLHCDSTWFVRYPMHGGEPQITVPLRLHNPTDTVCSVADLPLDFTPQDLTERRSGVGAAPRRLVWSGEAWRGRRPAVEVGS